MGARDRLSASETSGGRAPAAGWDPGGRALDYRYGAGDLAGHVRLLRGPAQLVLLHDLCLVIQLAVQAGEEHGY
jgi:hypothetical protein